MVVLIVVLGLLFIFLAVIFYFFCVAFVKRDVGNMDDVNAPCNKVLGEFKEPIAKGIEYINSTPHKWVETVSFDGLKLKGRYYDNAKKNTVIIFHGYRSSAARDMSCAVQMYSSFGFNVLLVDQRAHGRSEGRLITFGVKESRDVLSWVNFVTEKYAPQKIVLGGMSMGATTVLLATSQGLPPTVKAVVADCGYTSPVDIIKIVAEKDFKIKADFFIPFLDLFCRIFGKFSIVNISTVDSLKNCKIPVMMIHGEADGFVPCEMSKQAIKSCNEKSRLLTVDGADHGFSFLIDKPRVLQEIKDFLISADC